MKGLPWYRDERDNLCYRKSFRSHRIGCSQATPPSFRWYLLSEPERVLVNGIYQNL